MGSCIFGFAVDVEISCDARLFGVIGQIAQRDCSSRRITLEDKGLYSDAETIVVFHSADNPITRCF